MFEIGELAGRFGLATIQHALTCKALTSPSASTSSGWKVIATDVKDNTDYRVRFLSSGDFQGFRAD